jgi:diguanylate cyclase (GGDEF)-like protein
VENADNIDIKSKNKILQELNSLRFDFVKMFSSMQIWSSEHLKEFFSMWKVFKSVKEGLEQTIFRKDEQLVLASSRINLLRESTRIDPRTRLLNPQAFEERVESVLIGSSESICTFGLVDLNSFKIINDTYGHDVGDSVLCVIAKILRDQLRSGDVAGRVGGDEFKFFAALPHEELSLNLAERIRDAVDNYDWAHIHKDLRVKIDIGIVCVLFESTGFDISRKAFQKADRLMYLCKNLSRQNSCVNVPFAIWKVKNSEITVVFDSETDPHLLLDESNQPFLPFY